MHALLGYAPTSEEQPLAGRVLVVPFWIGGAISALELIDEHGRKSSLVGGFKKGGCWIAGHVPAKDELTTPILIGEGTATVLSAYRATEWVARNPIERVGQVSASEIPRASGAAGIRERHPDRRPGTNRFR